MPGLAGLPGQTAGLSRAMNTQICLTHQGSEGHDVSEISLPRTVIIPLHFTIYFLTPLFFH